MKYAFVLVAFLLFSFGCKSPDTTQSAGTQPTQKSPEEIEDSTVQAIKRTFESDSPAATYDSFMKAVRMGDGQSAVEMLAPESLEYYANIYKTVMTGSAQEVKSLPVSEQIMILMSRLLLPQRGLENMDTPTFFRNLVETGSIDKVALGLIRLGNIETEGTTARTIAFLKDTPANASVTFTQTASGSWEMDLSEVIPKATANYAERFAKLNMDVDQHVRNTVKAFSENGEFPLSLYQPIQ